MINRWAFPDLPGPSEGVDPATYWKDQATYWFHTCMESHEREHKMTQKWMDAAYPLQKVDTTPPIGDPPLPENWVGPVEPISEIKFAARTKCKAQAEDPRWGNTWECQHEIGHEGKHSWDD